MTWKKNSLILQGKEKFSTEIPY